MAAGTTSSAVVCFVWLLLAVSSELSDPQHENTSVESDHPFQQYCIASNKFNLADDVKHALKKLDTVLDPPSANMPESAEEYCLGAEHLYLIDNLKRKLEKLHLALQPPSLNTPQGYCSDPLNLVGKVEHVIKNMDNVVLRPPFPNLPETLVNAVDHMNVDGIKHIDLDEPTSKSCTENGPSVQFSMSTSRTVEITLIRKRERETVAFRSPRIQFEGRVTQMKPCNTGCIVDDCFAVHVKVVDMGPVTFDLPNAAPAIRQLMPRFNALLSGTWDLHFKIAFESALIDTIRKGLM